ncbi:MAG: hypothetical protein AAFX85_15240, partial [Pseudomonadota bacterium]
MNTLLLGYFATPLLEAARDRGLLSLLSRSGPWTGASLAASAGTDLAATTQVLELLERIGWLRHGRLDPAGAQLRAEVDPTLAGQQPSVWHVGQADTPWAQLLQGLLRAPEADDHMISWHALMLGAALVPLIARATSAQAGADADDLVTRALTQLPDTLGRTDIDRIVAQLTGESAQALAVPSPCGQPWAQRAIAYREVLARSDEWLAENTEARARVLRAWREAW